MKKSKKKGTTKNINPLDNLVWNTERSDVAILMRWMCDIIAKKNLDLGKPDVDTSGGDKKSPDMIIYESRLSKRALVVIEAKPPYYRDVFDEDNLKKPAHKKATFRKAKYFATTNFRELIWFNTSKVTEMLPEEEQIVEKFTLSDIENLDDIKLSRYSNPIKNGLEIFLTKLYNVHTGKEHEPKQAIDEFLVYRLQQKIKVLSYYYRYIIDEVCQGDPKFAGRLKDWFIEQGWSFAWQPDDFDKAARQAAYLLVNKILFYHLLQAKRPDELNPLEVAPHLTKGELLQANLQAYFEQVIKHIDYQTIYTSEFIDETAFPNVKEVVKEIKELIQILKRYDFSKIGYDIIGKIFERLIPQNERHTLGQYFTRPDVVDFILCFCLKHESDKIIDPACGAGTFMVRAYEHKKMMNQRLSHEAILETIWGVDIAKFPAHLSTINLAINDLNCDNNYPNVIHEDFFRVPSYPKGGFDLPEKWRRIRAKTLGLEEREVTFPHWFDAIVGNPPYTRQEEISEMGVDKQQLIDSALKDGSGQKLADIERTAGIHAYFFVHGTKFLKDNGYFGFIVTNSWLDAEYGIGLQEFFLKNFKIVAIIESQVELWFEDADVNTCIIILQKCDSKETRNANLVKFVSLKRPLRHFIPQAQDNREKEVERLSIIDALKEKILTNGKYYETNELRIWPIKQELLWKEGYDTMNKKYKGSKWGKYLRAPKVFFKIIKKAGSKLIPLREVTTNICRGFTTGADPWFYVKDITKLLNRSDLRTIVRAFRYRGNTRKVRVIESGDGTRWLIEKKYIHPVVRSPEKYRAVFIRKRKIDDFVLIVKESKKELRRKLVMKYILHGERKAYKMGKDRYLIPAKTETCVSRNQWYTLPNIKPSHILWQKAFDISLRHYFAERKTLANQRFYHIYPKNEEFSGIILAILNSPLVSLCLEFQRSTMALGAIEATVDEVKDMLVIDPRVIRATPSKKLLKVMQVFDKRQVGSVFDEIGAVNMEDVTLDKVKDDRRELDKIILCDILQLSEKDLVSVYKAWVDSVRCRIEKAKSSRKTKKTREGIDIEAFVTTVMNKIGNETIGKFYKTRILSLKSLKTRKLPKVKGDIVVCKNLFGWHIKVGRKHIDCSSESEADYLDVFLQIGLETVRIPRGKAVLDRVSNKLGKLKRRIDKIVASYLDSIVSTKTKRMLSNIIWSEIMKE